jgi:hypothetical protein
LPSSLSSFGSAHCCALCCRSISRSFISVTQILARTNGRWWTWRLVPGLYFCHFG